MKSPLLVMSQAIQEQIFMQRSVSPSFFSIGKTMPFRNIYCRLGYAVKYRKARFYCRKPLAEPMAISGMEEEESEDDYLIFEARETFSVAISA